MKFLQVNQLAVPNIIELVFNNRLLSYFFKLESEEEYEGKY